MEIKRLTEMGSSLGISLADDNAVLISSKARLVVAKTETGLLIAECDPDEAREIATALGADVEILAYT